MYPDEIGGKKHYGTKTVESDRARPVGTTRFGQSFGTAYQTLLQGKMRVLAQSQVVVVMGIVRQR